MFGDKGRCWTIQLLNIYLTCANSSASSTVVNDYVQLLSCWLRALCPSHKLEIWWNSVQRCWASGMARSVSNFRAATALASFPRLLKTRLFCISYCLPQLHHINSFFLFCFVWREHMRAPLRIFIFLCYRNGHCCCYNWVCWQINQNDYWTFVDCPLRPSCFRDHCYVIIIF